MYCIVKVVLFYRRAQNGPKTSTYILVYVCTLGYYCINGGLGQEC